MHRGVTVIKRVKSLSTCTCAEWYFQQGSTVVVTVYTQQVGYALLCLPEIYLVYQARPFLTLHKG